jgi:hypothetical protein
MSIQEDTTTTPAAAGQVPALGDVHDGFTIIAVVPAPSRLPLGAGPWYVTGLDRTEGYAATWHVAATAGGLAFTAAVRLDTTADPGWNADRALVNMCWRAQLRPA